MVFVNVKTIKLVWPSERIIPVMLLSLSLSLLGGFAYFLWSLLRVYVWPYPNLDPTVVYPEQACELAVFPFLPVMFLAVAVILNIDKWLYFYFRIIAEHRSMQDITSKSQEMATLQSRRKLLNLIHLTLIAVYLSVTVGLMGYGCTHDFR
jgi:hypothetical protein